jgi:hypothetical protein
MSEPTRFGGLLKNLTILVLPLAALGCATVAEPQSTVAGMVCYKELPTGSNLPVTKCVTEEERQRQKEQVEQVGSEIQRANSNKARGSGV